MAIYEVVLRQRYEEQEIVNRWNYITSSTPSGNTGAFGLITALGAISLDALTVMGALQVLQNVAVNFIDIEARNIFSDTDFYTRPFASSTNGEAIGIGLSPVAAFGFRTSRTRRDVRRATKRFVGVTEEQQSQGGILIPATLAEMDLLATAMGDSIEYDSPGGTIVYEPAVCSKVEYTTPSGKKAYKYRANEAEQLEHTMTGFVWEPYDSVRSQTSRQYSRGR